MHVGLFVAGEQDDDVAAGLESLPPQFLKREHDPRLDAVRFGSRLQPRRGFEDVDVHDRRLLGEGSPGSRLQRSQRAPRVTTADAQQVRLGLVLAERALLYAACCDAT